METYVSILRGINVSGHKLIKMDALREMFVQMGLVQVQTYIQSGNVIFQTKKSDTILLATKIEKEIAATFGFDVPVLVMSADQLNTIIQENPFLNDSEKDPAFFHITFLAAPPHNLDMALLEAKKAAHEAINITAQAVYLYCPKGYGNTKLNNTFLEAKLKVKATTRNWKTCNELLKLCQ